MMQIVVNREEHHLADGQRAKRMPDAIVIKLRF
jgi:hypothetical protein